MRKKLSYLAIYNDVNFFNEIVLGTGRSNIALCFGQGSRCLLSNKHS